VDEAIERGQQRGSTGKRLSDRRRIDAPPAGRGFDLDRLTGLAHRRGTGDAQRSQPSLVAHPQRLRERHDRRVRRVDALGQVPDALPALPTRNRDLAAGG
jgi:hypothetical protein